MPDDILKDVNSAGAELVNSFSSHITEALNVKKTAAKVIFSTFSRAEEFSRNAFAELPIDSLIINDVTLQKAAVTNVSVEVSSDVLIAETLRTSSPIIKAKGRGTDVVTVELAFPEGTEQAITLRRICSQLLYHPFVFIENTKIREIVAPYSTETMIFVLLNSSIYSSAQVPGVIHMTLQLATFNYKPFSHHYWYNAHVPGSLVKKENRNINIIPDFSPATEAIDYSSDLFDTISGIAFSDIESVNSPTVFPVNSKSWMYYANHLSSLVPSVGEHNSDFIKFRWKEYSIINPPLNARRGSALAADFFAEDNTKKKIKPWYDATNQSSAIGYDKATYAERYAASVTEVVSTGGGKLKQAVFTGGVRTPYYISDLDRLWMGRFLAGEHWTWTEKHAKQRISGFSFMMWSMMNRFMSVPAYKNKRLFKFLIDYSEPLHRGGWQKAGAFSKDNVDRKRNENRMKSQTAAWKDIPATIRDFVNMFAAGQIAKPTLNGQILYSDGKWREGSASVLKYTDFAEKNFVLKNGLEKWSDRAPAFLYERNIYVSAKGASTVATVKASPQSEGIPCDGDITISSDNPSAVQEAYKPKITEKEEPDTCDESHAEFQSETADQEAKEAIRQKDKEKEKNKPSILKRIEWIRDRNKEGYIYYSGDDSVRNVFYRYNEISVGGDGHGSLANVAVESVSVQFGHRLAQMKLLGQKKSTWQFLGAGNRSGSISLVAGGNEGRTNLQFLKDIINKVYLNASKFNYIKDSSTIEIDIIDPGSKDGINNALALINAKNIVVTNTIEETNSKEGIDIHRLIIEFVVQEFEEEKFKQRDGISFSTKMSMAKSILSSLKATVNQAPKEELESAGGFWDFAEDVYEDFKMGAGLVVGAAQDQWSKTLGIKSWEGAYNKVQGHRNIMYALREARDRHIVGVNPIKNNVSVPNSFLQLAHQAANLIREIYTDLPLLNIPVKGVTPSVTWEQKIANDLGEMTPILFGGYGILGGKFKGFNYYEDYNEASRMMSQLYRKFLSKMNSIVVDAISLAKDKKNFINFFGPKVYEDITNALVDQAGACYDDLKYPNKPGTSVPLPPEYYVYDDSLENATLGFYNDRANLERMIKSHILNQAKSLQHITTNALLGGAYVSANMARIKQTKLDLNEKFGAEYGFQAFLPGEGISLISQYEGATNMMFAEGAKKVLSVIDYVGTPKAMKDYVLDQYSKLSFSNFQGTKEQKAADGFLNSVLAMSPHLSQYSSNTDKGKIVSAERGRLYGDLKSHFYNVEENSTLDLQLGPNQQESVMEAKKMGTMSDPEPGDNRQTIDLDGWEYDQYREFYSSDVAPGDVAPGLLPGDPPPPPAATESTPDLLSKAGATIALETRKKDLSMRRAYPTFKIYFIEEDSQQGSRNYVAYDDFYSYSAIQELRIIRSRKVPADLAIIRMTNVSGIIFRKRFGTSIKEEIDAHRGNGPSEDATGIFSETEKENPFNRMIMQDGVKVQIRLGYSSDPDLLESVFLGQIVEVQPSEDSEILQIVCQGYGVELDAARCGDGEDESVFFSTQEALSAAIIQPFIVNFGRRDVNASYNPAEIRSSWTGGLGEDLFSLNMMDRSVQAARTEMLKRFTFENLPQDDNIFAPPPSVYASGWKRFWNNACVYRPIGVTPWEIFKEHELRHPGYVSLAVPYGHSTRMTMFFGARGQNYWSMPMSEKEERLIGLWGDYLRRFGIDELMKNPAHAYKRYLISKKDPALWQALVRSYSGPLGNINNLGFHLGRVFGRYRPFRNYHMLTSEHHILKNEIRTSVQGTYNTVEVRYSETEDIKDEDNGGTQEAIQQISIGEDGVYTLKLDDNIPENLVRKHTAVFPSCITQYMAQRYAQGLLIQGLKDTYRGDLVIIGEETLKPYDICMINDTTTDMYGPIEVEQVVHIFNREQGFISIITPDLCVDFNEWVSKGYMDCITNTMSLMYASGSELMKGQLGRTFPIGDNKFMGSLMPLMGAAMVMHWDQTGSPYVISPLYMGGKPFLSLTTGPKFGSTIMSMWGKWVQYWEDWKDGVDRTDINESLLETGADVVDWAGSFFNASQGG